MNLAPVIVCSCMGIAIVFLAAKDLRRQRKRQAEWQRIADESDFVFLGKDNDVISRYALLRLFGTGADRRFCGAIEKSDGDTRITVGDYYLRGGEAGGNGACAFTACILELPNVRLPRCHLRPQVPCFDRARTALGYQDINFEDDPDFSDAFVLEGKPKAVIEQIFDVKVRAWFTERIDDHVSLEMRDNLFVLYHRGQCDPANAAQFVKETQEILRRLTTCQPEPVASV